MNEREQVPKGATGKAAVWESWLEDTLLPDLGSNETPDPVPFSNLLITDSRQAVPWEATNGG